MGSGGVKCWTVKLLVRTGCMLVLRQISSHNPEVGVVDLAVFAVKTKPKVKIVVVARQSGCFYKDITVPKLFVLPCK